MSCKLKIRPSVITAMAKDFIFYANGQPGDIPPGGYEHSHLTEGNAIAVVIEFLKKIEAEAEVSDEK